MTEVVLKRLAALCGSALVLVIAAGSIIGSRAAADDLKPRAERALEAAGVSEIDVDVAGREARLAGPAGPELAEAARVVGRIAGVRRVDVEPVPRAEEVVTSPTVPTLDLRRAGGGVTISGTVPDVDTAVEIKADVAETFGVALQGDLVVDPAVGGAPWLDDLPEALDDIVRVDALVLQIDGTGTIAVTGSVDNAVEAATVTDGVTAAMPGLEVVVDLRMRAS